MKAVVEVPEEFVMAVYARLQFWITDERVLARMTEDLRESWNILPDDFHGEDHQFPGKDYYRNLAASILTIPGYTVSKTSEKTEADNG